MKGFDVIFRVFERGINELVRLIVIDVCYGFSRISY